AELEEALAHLRSGQLVNGAGAAVAEMVVVVYVPFAAAQLKHVPQRVDQVLASQGHHRLGDVLVELAVDAEEADAAEAVAVLVEELLVEERRRFVELRRVAGPQAGINLQQRRLV